ncbi:MAG: hypothetical protein H8D35_07910, partial [Nitrosopumilus sp.]|nr:hypothetical protein [Nitrosopumilus sp.]
MKSVIIIAIAFVFLFVPIGAYADTITVDIAKGSSTPACASSNSCYSPYTTIISSGDKVIWKNSDSVTHTITGGSPDDGPSGVFDSSTVSRGGSYAFTFEYAGSYDYFCMVHPWMEGIVVVQEKQKSSTSITLNLSKTSAYEGELVDVSGRLTSNGKPIPFTSVDIYEFDATSFDDKLGTLRTDSDGRFSNPFKTRDLDTGDGKDIAAILDILAIAVYCPVSCVSAVNNFINLAESSTVELYAKFPGNNNYKSSSSCKHPCREDTVTILESSNTMKGKVFNAVLSSTVPGGDLTTGILSSIVNSNQVSISQYDEIVSKYRLAFKTELGINANSLSLDEMKSLLDNPTELKKLKESQNKSNFTPKTTKIIPKITTPATPNYSSKITNNPNSINELINEYGEIKKSITSHQIKKLAEYQELHFENALANAKLGSVLNHLNGVTFQTSDYNVNIYSGWWMDGLHSEGEYGMRDVIVDINKKYDELKNLDIEIIKAKNLESKHKSKQSQDEKKSTSKQSQSFVGSSNDLKPSLYVIKDNGKKSKETTVKPNDNFTVEGYIYKNNIPQKNTSYKIYDNIGNSKDGETNSKGFFKHIFTAEHSNYQ